jgi:hypothetical protein
MGQEKNQGLPSVICKAENMDLHPIKHHGENVNTWLKMMPYGTAA